MAILGLAPQDDLPGVIPRPWTEERKKTDMATLGELERAMMDLLWESSEALTANELRERLAQNDAGRAQAKGLAVTTVLTVLSRLEKKALVARERDIRPHRYRAVTTRAEHTAELMHEVLGSANDREAVLARFVGSVSATEAQTLRRLLEGA